MGCTLAASSLLGEVFLPLLLLLESCHGTVNRGKQQLDSQTGGLRGVQERVFSMHVAQVGERARNLRWLQRVRLLWEMLVAFYRPSTKRKVLLKCR